MNPEAVAEAFHAFEQGSEVSPLSAAAVSNQTIQESMRLLLMVRAYQVRPDPCIGILNIEYSLTGVQGVAN